jgi:hypothetical protein
MSTDIHGPSDTPHELQLTTYWGGDALGTCVQLTGRNCDDAIGYVGMTVEEAAEVGTVLQEWVKERRKNQ